MKHGAHRADRQPRRRGRTAVAVAALLGAVLVLMGGQGTFAFWTDNANVSTGNFSSGTLDITLNGQLKGPTGAGGTTPVAALSLANMVPGESVAATFPIANEGTVPLAYSVTGTGAGELAVVNGLQYAVVPGTASNTGSAAAGNRSGSCNGSVTSDGSTTLLTGTPSPLLTPARTLTAGSTATICVVVRLHSDAPNSMQGKSGTALLRFNATQVGP